MDEGTLWEIDSGTHVTHLSHTCTCTCKLSMRSFHSLLCQKSGAMNWMRVSVTAFYCKWPVPWQYHAGPEVIIVLLTRTNGNHQHHQRNRPTLQCRVNITRSSCRTGPRCQERRRHLYSPCLVTDVVFIPLEGRVTYINARAQHSAGAFSVFMGAQACALRRGDACIISSDTHGLPHLNRRQIIQHQANCFCKLKYTMAVGAGNHHSLWSGAEMQKTLLSFILWLQYSPKLSHLQQVTFNY